VGKSKIEWTDRTWNPVTGCTKISSGCANCYAERMSKRLAGRGGYDKDEPFKVTRHVKRLGEPLRWKKQLSRIFVCSMGDLFHEDVPNWVIDEIFGVIMACNKLINVPDHTFMVLTKRPERMLKYLTEREPVQLLKEWAKVTNWLTLDDADITFEELIYSTTCHDWDENGRNSSGSEYKPWGYIDKLWPLPNVWLGVTAENQEQADARIPVLLQIPAAVRFVSVEPMLSAVDISQYLSPMFYAGEEKPAPPGINTKPYRPARIRGAVGWVICGGESGPGARPMHPDWALGLRDQCVAADVSFFFKQWGEWETFYDRDNDDPDWRNVPGEKPGVCRLNLAGGCGFHGERVVYLHRVGKKKAGRLLDGQTWDEMPGVE